MAVIHSTTLTPTKLELLAAWLPAQPWYTDRGRAPELQKAGGFRLDDPDGEVGIEFMVVTDGSDASAVAYLVPMTYRGSALDGADGGLIGTPEHGVLGRRWIYDGVGDPVLVEQLTALIQGRAKAQMQSVSDTPDPTVTCVPVAGGELVITVNRVLQPDDANPDHDPAGGADQGRLSAPWRLPDGTPVRGCLAVVQYIPA